jgi:hypothetical protein
VTAGADGACGHTVVDGDNGLEHHEIPDDGAAHEAATGCGCGPRRDACSGHPVFVHIDQEHDPDDPDDWDQMFNS